MKTRREAATATPALTWERALLCARYALEKKAYDLTVLEVAELTSVAKGGDDF